MALVRAMVKEVARDGSVTGRGEFGFVQLPAPGDRVVVGNNRGGLDILAVHYVEYHAKSESPTSLAWAAIHAGLIEQTGGWGDDPDC